MSRSNHYRICKDCTAETPCWFHEDNYFKYIHKPERIIVGRRTWQRKQRWPHWSAGSTSGAPPRWWWQDQHARARRTLDAMIRKSDDPVLPAEKQLIDLYSWY